MFKFLVLFYVRMKRKLDYWSSWNHRFVIMLLYMLKNMMKNSSPTCHVL